MVNNWLNIIQNYLLPPTCILCGSPGYQQLDLCEHCYQDLPYLTHGCPRCAGPLPINTDDNNLCGDCLAWPPAFDQTLAVVNYQPVSRYLITQLKFNARYQHARLLGQLMAQHLHAITPKPQALIPVPLHSKRYRERKFNQSIEIARTLSQQLDIPLVLDCCIRQRDTPQQSLLTRKQRLKNLHKAFAIQCPVNVQHVALVDDVMTTGTTLHELADVLKKQGVARVEAWVFARA